MIRLTLRRYADLILFLGLKKKRNNLLAICFEWSKIEAITNTLQKNKYQNDYIGLMHAFTSTQLFGIIANSIWRIESR